MKECPYCGEEIQDLAKKCRFCGEWLEGKEENLSQKSEKIIHEKKQKSPIHHEKVNEDVVVKKDELAGVSEENRKFIDKFSWGGFCFPTVMLFYNQQYVWAVLGVVINIFRWFNGFLPLALIPTLLPRLIIGGITRRKAYLNNKYKNMEIYKEKLKNMEMIGMIVGIIYIAVVIMRYTSS